MKKTMLLAVLALILAVSMLPAALADTCSGSECTHVVGIGSKHFNSVQEAINAAQDGDTIVILKSHKMDSEKYTVVPECKIRAVVVITGKAVTIDLNGNKLEGDFKYDDFNLGAGEDVDGFLTYAGGKLTLLDSKGGGIVDFKIDEPFKSLLRNYSADSGITVKSGSYYLNKARSSMFYSNISQCISIEGGYFFLENIGAIGVGGQLNPWHFDSKGMDTGYLPVSGGTFNADIFHQFYTLETGNDINQGLRNNGDGTYTIVDAVAWVDEYEQLYTKENWTEHDVGYATFEEAVAAAVKEKDTRSNVRPDTSFSTVTLLRDCTAEKTAAVTRNTTIAGSGVVTGRTGDKPMIEVADGVTLTLSGGGYKGKISTAGTGKVVLAPDEDTVLSFFKPIPQVWFPVDKEL